MHTLFSNKAVYLNPNSFAVGLGFKYETEGMLH
jgi:hypothetical protein